jgi:hypothetical protein
MAQQHINPKTGEVIEWDGNAWKTVRPAQFPQAAEARPQTGREKLRERVKAEGILPEWLVNAGDAFSNATDALLSGQTLGLSDEVGAFGETLTEPRGIKSEITGRTPYEEALAAQRGSQAEFAQRNPVTATTLGVVGSLGGVGPGASLAVPASVGQTVKQGAVAGGALGAASGFGNAEGGPMNRGMGAAVGGATGGAVGAALPLAVARTGKAVGAVRGTNPPKAAPAPTIDELRATSQAAYNSPEVAGLQVSAPSLQGFAADVSKTLAKSGFDAEGHPGVARALTRLLKDAENPMALEDLDILRQFVDDMGKDPKQGRLTGIMIDKLDDYIAKLQPEDVLAGDAVAGNEQILKARDAWSRMKKTATLEDAVQHAEDNAAVSGVGGNSENTMRQAVNRILHNRKKLRGFSTEEQQLMRDFIRGSNTQNFLRMVAGFAPNKGLVPAMGTIGLAAVTGSPLVAALPAAGMAAKGIGSMMRESALDNLLTAIASGQAPAPAKALGPASRAAAQFAATKSAEQIGRLAPSYMPQSRPAR